jgi:hypothetical protein
MAQELGCYDNADIDAREFLEDFSPQPGIVAVPDEEVANAVAVKQIHTLRPRKCVIVPALWL